MGYVLDFIREFQSGFFPLSNPTPAGFLLSTSMGNLRKESRNGLNGVPDAFRNVGDKVTVFDACVWAGFIHGMMVIPKNVEAGKELSTFFEESGLTRDNWLGWRLFILCSEKEPLMRLKLVADRDLEYFNLVEMRNAQIMENIRKEPER